MKLIAPQIRFYRVGGVAGFTALLVLLALVAAAALPRGNSGDVFIAIPLGVFLLLFSGIVYARTARYNRTLFGVLIFPFVLTAILAIYSVQQSAHWPRFSLGVREIECLLSIPVIAAAPLALMSWLVVRSSPEHSIVNGALSGHLAGTLIVIGYAIHCSNDPVIFYGFWYGGTIMISAITGAVVALLSSR